MNTHKDFEEFFAVLRGKNVEFIVIGGVAFNYHARPRATKDIDIWVRPTLPNLTTLVEAIGEFGFPVDGLEPTTLADNAEVLMLGRAPYRIDILTQPSGLDWASAWANSVATTYGEAPIQVLGLDALIQSKRAAARPRDLADVLELETIRKARGH